MASIEVQTAQNVTIEYKLANVIERFAAWLLDFIIQTAVYLLLVLLLFQIFPTPHDEAIHFIISSSIILLYHPLMETLNNGQSLGKMIMKIKVIKVNGDNPNLFDYIMRWTFRLIDIGISVGTIAVLTISTSNRNQRIGDFLSDMVVIKVSTQERVSITSVMKIGQLKDYTPQYPEIRNFTEEDMLLIKETIDRFNRYKTPGHRKAMEEIFAKIESQLEIPIPKENKIGFLNTLIKDYVVLTR